MITLDQAHIEITDYARAVYDERFPTMGMPLEAFVAEQLALPYVVRSARQKAGHERMLRIRCRDCFIVGVYRPFPAPIFIVVTIFDDEGQWAVLSNPAGGPSLGPKIRVFDPVPADYTAARAAELAAWRDATKEWRAKRARRNQRNLANRVQRDRDEERRRQVQRERLTQYGLAQRNFSGQLPTHLSSMAVMVERDRIGQIPAEEASFIRHPSHRKALGQLYAAAQKAYTEVKGVSDSEVLEERKAYMKHVAALLHEGEQQRPPQ